MYSIQNTLLSTEKNMSQLEKKSKFEAPKEHKISLRKLKKGEYGARKYKNMVEEAMRYKSLNDADREKMFQYEWKLAFNSCIRYFRIVGSALRIQDEDGKDLTMRASEIKYCEKVVASTVKCGSGYSIAPYTYTVLYRHGALDNVGDDYAWGDYQQNIDLLEHQNLEAIREGYLNEKEWAKRTAWFGLENTKCANGDNLFLNRNLRLAILDFAFTDRVRIPETHPRWDN
jgi:hypothetical protein